MIKHKNATLSHFFEKIFFPTCYIIKELFNGVISRHSPTAQLSHRQRGNREDPCRCATWE